MVTGLASWRIQRSILLSTNSFPLNIADGLTWVVNGSFWLGAAAGALAAPVLLDQNLFPVNVGWRLGFGIEGSGRIFNPDVARRFVPESPRWLVTHCRSEEAEETVKRIEADVETSTGRNLPLAHGSLEVHPRKVFGLGLILTTMLGRYRWQTQHFQPWCSW